MTPIIAGPRNGEQATIRVESGTVYVVPFPFARSYFAFEIEDEGFHRSDCHPVVLLGCDR